MAFHIISFLFLIILLIGVAYGGVPGGVSPIDVNDERVKEAASFAVTQTYPHDAGIQYLIISATKQVVRGILYDITVDVYSLPCTVKEFKVLSFQGLQLLSAESLNLPCQDVKTA